MLYGVLLINRGFIMNNLALKALIESAYENKECVKFDDHRNQCDNFEHVQTFHMHEVYCITLDDNNFCGIRADHFSIEFGWSESLYDEYRNAILISANHKGIRKQVLLGVNKND